jgi:hypothetical protein
MKRNVKGCLLVGLVAIASPSLAETSDHVLGFGLGVSTGLVSADTGTTISKISTVSYSAIAYSAFTNFDISSSVSLETGAELLILLASAQSNQSVSKSGYGAVKYHVLGGSHQVSEGSKAFSITKSAPLRVSIPAYLKYDSIDFSVDNDGSKTAFTGALLEIASGVQVEKDFGSMVSGAMLTKTISTILISSKSIKIDAFSLILSTKIYF